MDHFDKFLATIAVGKKNKKDDDIGGKFISTLKDEIMESNPFYVQSKNVEIIKEDYPYSYIETILNSTPETIKETPDTNDSPTYDLSRYFTDKSFQQPNPVPPEQNFKAITDKIKFLESWLAKVSTAGPGGGAGEVYNLDFPTITITANYSIIRKDYYIGCRNTTAINITLPLSNAVKNGRVLTIKDELGTCSTNNIHIIGTVDNDAGGFTLAINNASIQLLYNNGWRII